MPQTPNESEDEILEKKNCGDCSQLQFTWNKLRCEDIYRNNLFKTIIVMLTL